jgi:hypothetical protein
MDSVSGGPLALARGSCLPLFVFDMVPTEALPDHISPLPIPTIQETVSSGEVRRRPDPGVVLVEYVSWSIAILIACQFQF